MDTGAIIAQRSVDIENGETVDSLKEKVQSLEKILYPEIIQLYAEGKISVEGKKVVIKK